MKLHPKVKQLTDDLLLRYRLLSKREQGMVIGCIAIVVIMIVYGIVQPISNALDEQTVELRQLETKVKTVPTVAERYIKLKSRRDEIEKQYKEIEFKEGVLSHLENLIKTKALVPSGFTIRNGQPRPFAGKYEQIPFSIKFQTTNFPALVDFFREISHGPRPLILGRIDIQKPRSGTRLDVDIDVSSIARKDNSNTSASTPNA